MINSLVEKYIAAEEDLERVSNNGSSSFMDVSVRIDRVKVAKDKAIQHLGKQSLKAIITSIKQGVNDD